MKPRFLLDEHLSPRVAEQARRAGLDVRAVAGSPLAGRDDREILRAAIEDGRILVTYDLKDMSPLFGDFIKSGTGVPGIVFVDRKTIPTPDLRGLVRCLAKLAGAIEAGTVDPAGGVFLRR